MIRALVRVATALAVGAWLADRRLRARAGHAPPDPVRTFVVIDAPPERVWQEIADVEGQPRWMTDLKSVRIETDEPVAEGTVATGTVRMFGIRVEDPIVITAFEAPRRFAIRHDGLFKGAGEITLEPGADGTTTIVRWEEQLVPPALPHLGAALMRPALVNVFQADLHRLRRLIEA